MSFRTCRQSLSSAGAYVTTTERHTAQLEHSNTVLVCHDPADCAGRPCTLHNRTDHHMRHWRQHWRSDRLLMERICSHGVGHPDPDSFPGIDTVHGCDGCCALPKLDDELSSIERRALEDIDHPHDCGCDH